MGRGLNDHKIKFEAPTGFNHLNSKDIYLIFQPLEVVSRYRDPQLQVAEY